MKFDRCHHCLRLPDAATGREDTARLAEQLLCAWTGCEVGVMAADHAIDVLARRLADKQD